MYINDDFNNHMNYEIPKAQLILTDIPYNIGKDAYGSNRHWWVDGVHTHGKSEKADSMFFSTDLGFDLDNFMSCCAQMLRPDTKEKGTGTALIIFCAFQQINELMEVGRKYGFKKSYPLVFIKASSPQVLKANMKIVGATEYAIVLYRDKLPKFNNQGKMIKNWFEWKLDRSIKKIHPTQKPTPVLEKLIEIFTDENDVIIDPCAGSGTTLYAGTKLKRRCYGFEIDKELYQKGAEFLNENILL
jgi:site-specific DNA-methyltransferase (adenine-specific)